MESAEDAQWCDFCKEPFNKGKKAPAPTPAPPVAPPPAPADGKKLSEEELLKLVPKEFLREGDGEKVPTLPPWFKGLAWTFLAVWAISGVLVMIALIHRKKG